MMHAWEILREISHSTNMIILLYTEVKTNLSCYLLVIALLIQFIITTDQET